jgi:tetraacyldisaccharide 4'-kinase
MDPMRITSLFARIADPEERALPVTALRAALRPASSLFGLGAGLRNRGYDAGLFPRAHLPAAVISVGSLTVGGAGKTPVVRYLAGLLSDGGYRTAVLSRGYGRRTARTLAAVEGCAWQEVGDEPALLASALPGVPVIVGADREAGGWLAIRDFGAEVLLLDDGFQHRRMARDLDIVVLDGLHPAGNGRLLPAGPLREPVTALRRAQAVVLTRVDQTPCLETARRLVQTVNSRIPVIESVYRPARLRRLAGDMPLPMDHLRGRRVLTLSGIANPASFDRTVEGLGASVVRSLRFPDHHPFSPVDIARALHLARTAGADGIVTTEKDAVRIPPSVLQPDIVSLDIALSLVSGEADVKNLMLACGLLKAG